MNDPEALLDALARLCGAFSAVVRGNAPDFKRDPFNCPAYAEACSLVGHGLAAAPPMAPRPRDESGGAQAVRDFQRAAGDAGPAPRVVVGETVGASTASALRRAQHGVHCGVHGGGYCNCGLRPGERT